MSDATVQPDAVVPGMPSRLALVQEAVRRLDTAGVRSQVLKVDTRTLEDLGMRLTERGTPILAAHQWLNAELGGTADDEAINDKAVYRFAAHFRRLFEQVRAEHARRAARAAVEGSSDAELRHLTAATQRMLIEEVASRLMDREQEDVEPKELNTLALIVRRAQQTQVATDTLQIARAQAEQRAEKLALEIEELRREKERREAELRRSIDEAKKTVQTTSDGGSKPVSAEDVIAILDRVMKGEAA